MSWLKGNLLRRLIKNASILMNGNIFTAVIDLVSLAVTARVLVRKCLACPLCAQYG